MTSIILKTGPYKELLIWRKSIKLVTEVYKLTEKFPKTETYGIVSQMRRSAVSIPANIAEGKRRFTAKEIRRFFYIAYGSGAELETYIEISKQLSILDNYDILEIESLLNEIMKMLNRITSD